MTGFVLVPGACHGGWWYEPVVAGLRRAGHLATAVTLSGLDPDGPPAPAANLDTHIGDVLAVLPDQPVALVGHSYGGSVITGVADREPSRVEALLYLDAFVPEDGDSCWSMTNDEQRQWYVTGAGSTGLAVHPLPFFDERARPHPVGTLLQRSALSGAYHDVPRKRYVLATDAEWLPHSPFPAVAERLRGRPDWRVLDVDSPHNFLAQGPETVLKLILDLA